MKFDHLYVLDENGNPRQAKDELEWAVFFEKADRVVAQETFGESFVSTVFLGIDQEYIFGNPGDGPVLWETMVFGGVMDSRKWLCGGTREDAKRQHDEVAELVDMLRPKRKKK